MWHSKEKANIVIGKNSCFVSNLYRERETNVLGQQTFSALCKKYACSSFLQRKCVSFKIDPIKYIMTSLYSALSTRFLILSKFAFGILCFHFPKHWWLLDANEVKAKLHNFRAWFLNHYYREWCGSHGIKNDRKWKDSAKTTLPLENRKCLTVVGPWPHYNDQKFYYEKHIIIY